MCLFMFLLLDAFFVIIYLMSTLPEVKKFFPWTSNGNLGLGP